MLYQPSHIANYMLDRADEEELSVSPMKLLKLVYIGYGWHLALTDERLFDEPIYAWKHGPVVPSLYHEFKHFGADPITGRATILSGDTGDTLEVETPRVASKDEAANNVLSAVWDVYKGFSASVLRNKTHEEGTPWYSFYEEGKQDIRIPDESIKSHFTDKIRQYVEQAD